MFLGLALFLGLAEKGHLSSMQNINKLPQTGFANEFVIAIKRRKLYKMIKGDLTLPCTITLKSKKETFNILV